MTTWWRKALTKMNYVTEEHFDAQMVEINEKFDKIFTILDQILVIITRLDQERYAAINRFERIENDVARIKQHLKLA
jgi:hypothetical protein